jgi:hypothetical protein
MGCKRKICGKNKVKAIEVNNVRWADYPLSKESGYGHSKFCYFISCPDSVLPIRDYLHQGKLEPSYERKSYNEYRGCNQSGIRNARNRGISYIIFYTKYQGRKENYKNRYFITGLFPISGWRKVDDRIAYRSDNPIFLSIEDSLELELTDKSWKKWFGVTLPRDKRGSHNLRYMAKFVERDSHASKDILEHFHKKKNLNKIDEYIKELTK